MPSNLEKTKFSPKFSIASLKILKNSKLSLLNSFLLIITINPLGKMKRNINKLIAQIERNASKNPKGRFKITSKNANQYTNKILVDANQYNKPSYAQRIVEEEMQDYRQAQKKAMKNFKEEVKQKKVKHLNLEQQIIRLEGCLSILIMQDVMAALRVAKRNELLIVRPKLIKLEKHLLFQRQFEELQPHIEEPLQKFLTELFEIINKTNKIPE